MTTTGIAGDRDHATVAKTDESTAPAVVSREAFQQLYQRCFRSLVEGIRATYGAGPPDPEDVVQTAFEKLSQREQLDDIKDPEGYLWIAARNTVLTEKRKEAVRNDNREEVARRYFSEGCDTFEPERVFSSQQEVYLVSKVLAEMPERRRRIFMLNRVHGLTPAEAGKRCGVSRSSAVRHIAIATERLALALSAARRDPALEVDA
ncbi:MAG: sigma-70 family RNA polymerase sigma factor [Pseudomonadota bacterium]